MEGNFCNKDPCIILNIIILIKYLPKKTDLSYAAFQPGLGHGLEFRSVKSLSTTVDHHICTLVVEAQKRNGRKHQ